MERAAQNARVLPLFETLTAALLFHKPEKPRKFIVEALQALKAGSGEVSTADVPQCSRRRRAGRSVDDSGVRRCCARAVACTGATQMPNTVLAWGCRGLHHARVYQR